MKKISITFALVIMTAVVAQAQTCRPGCRRPVGVPYYVPYTYRSATAAESHARGTAALIWARAQYNLMMSQAMINAAEAQRRLIENRPAYVESYFRSREINRHYRRVERQSPRRANGHVRQTNVNKPGRPRPIIVDQQSGTVL